MIYLDHAATTFPKPECVYDRVNQFQREGAVNVGRGGYQMAREASDMVDSCREKMAKLLNARSKDDVFFAPSATFAANQIILSLPWDDHKVVYLSPFEHNATARPIEKMREYHGFMVYLLPFDPVTQQLQEDVMARMFAKSPPDYIVVNHVSNVTGAILPLDLIAQEGKKYDACVIVDGCQSVGFLDYDLWESPIDFLIFTGHKHLYASFGVGGFLKNSDFPLVSMLTGGTGSNSLHLQMGDEGATRYELGSPNSIAIASLDTSLGWLEETSIAVIAAKKKHLMKLLQDGLQLLPVRSYLPQQWGEHILSFTHKDYTPHELGLILDQDFQIAVRTGYHCAPYIHDLLGTRETQGTVRVSLGYWNTEDEINNLLHALGDC